MRRLVVLVLLGCGGGGADELAIEDYHAEYETALCRNSAACGVFVDEAHCAGATFDTGFNYSAATLVGGVVAGLIAYDAAQARACIDAIAARSCAWNEALFDEPACETVFTGTVIDGGACNGPAECVSGHCLYGLCDAQVMCCPGTCSARPDKAVGDACGFDDECAPGLFCAIAGPNLDTCQPHATSGEECWEARGCDRTSLCMGFEGGIDPGTCLTAPGSGEACDTSDTWACRNSNERCDPASLTCIPLAAVGEACVITDDCVAAAACTDSLCEALGALGDPCGPGGFPICAGMMECMAGQCAEGPAPVACMAPM